MRGACKVPRQVELERLGRAFFERDAADVAKALVGVRLVHVRAGAWVEATIVETEAYRGPSDRACHARFGRTKAREHLFGAPGTAYVFLVYGMHHCFNVTCLREGSGHAVLLRAAEVSTALGRGDGPGRLARAMSLQASFGGEDLVSSKRLFFVREGEGSKRPTAVSPRVGVAYAGEDATLPLRFFDPTSPAISRPSKGAIVYPRDSRS